MRKSASRFLAILNSVFWPALLHRGPVPGHQQPLNRLLCYVPTHRVVHKPARSDHLSVVLEFSRFVHQIVRINSYTVSANQARAEWQKVPLCTSCLKYIKSIDTHSVKKNGKFIHKCNVHIALSILYNLGGLCHLHVWCPVHTRLHNQFIYLSNLLKRFGITARHNLNSILQRVL